MKMRRLPFSLHLFSLVLVYGLLCCGLVQGAEKWLPLVDPDANPGELLYVTGSDFESIEIDLSVAGLQYQLNHTKAGPFAELTLGDYGFSGEVGFPRLPAIREFLELPYGASMEARLIDPVYKEYSLAELGIMERLMPVQAPIPKLAGAREAAQFSINEAAYTATDYTQVQELRISEAGFLRGCRVGVLEVLPVNYNPGSKKIRVLTRATIKIRLIDSDSELTRSSMGRLASPDFDRLSSSLFANHRDFRANCLAGKKSGQRASGYLIIAHANYASLASLQDFIDLKTSIGFDVTKVTSATAGGSKQNIKNYIQNAVNTWPVPPEYVLLVGDTGNINAWSGSGYNSPDTDLNYACVVGTDYFPDVFLGRFSVTQAVHVNNLVQKIIDMESVSLKESVFMASEDNWSISEGTHNFVINNYLNGDGWSYDKRYCHTYNATTGQVSSSFNAGKSLAIYSGHGSTTYWADGPYFTKSNIYALNNTVYPAVMSFACITGEYTYGECFSETWIRDHKGAALCWASSVNSYWGEDDILEKRTMKGWYIQGLERFGPMSDYGKYQLYLYYGNNSTTRMYYEMYNVMGDSSYKVLGETSGGSFTNFGTGISSPTYGQPTISGSGDLTPGGLGFTIVHESVRPSTFGILFYGLTNSGGIPFSGGYFYPYPFLQAINVTVDGTGRLEKQFTIPAHFNHNKHVYMQTFFDDPSAPEGITGTEGLDLWVF